MIKGITWTHTISLESLKSFRGTLFRKPVTGQELCFAVSYSKPALRAYCPNIYTLPKGRTVTVIIDDLCTIAHKTSTQKYISDIEVEDVSHEVKNFTNQILKCRIYK